MRITRQCTLITSSAIVSQNRLNPIMQRAKIDRSVRRALPVYDNVAEAVATDGKGVRGSFRLFPHYKNRIRDLYIRSIYNFLLLTVPG